MKALYRTWQYKLTFWIYMVEQVESLLANLPKQNVSGSNFAVRREAPGASVSGENSPVRL